MKMVNESLGIVLSIWYTVYTVYLKGKILDTHSYNRSSSLDL